MKTSSETVHAASVWMCWPIQNCCGDMAEKCAGCEGSSSWPDFELLRILGSCDPPFTVVFADIGGNRELNHVVELRLAWVFLELQLWTLS